MKNSLKGGRGPWLIASRIEGLFAPRLAEECAFFPTRDTDAFSINLRDAGGGE